MHYADGQDAKPGDLIIYEDHSKQVAGILNGARSDTTSCNGTITPVAQRAKSDLGFGPWQPITGFDWWVTLSNCVPVDFENISEFSPQPPAASVVSISGANAGTQPTPGIASGA